MLPAPVGHPLVFPSSGFFLPSAATPQSPLDAPFYPRGLRMSASQGPLAGVTVLDLTEFIFGPYATQILGDLGADIIKVENPGGDRQRFNSKHAKHEDMGCTYMSFNRNKRSVTL